MPSNVEIKARVADLDRLKATAERLSDTPARAIDQEDTFFATAGGRLKLREFGDGAGELIHYDRPDAAGPTQSDYLITPTTDPAGLKAALSAALGVRRVVRKRRLLYRVGQTRVHLDRVEGLGDFVELEVVLSPGQSPEAGRRIAAELMAGLGIAEADRVDVAYVDLLERKGVTSCSSPSEKNS